jgi:hypothetical protein
MSDTISNIVQGVEQILRYVAPGFVALGLFILQFPWLVDKPDAIFRVEPGIALLAGLTMGVVLNSMHVALFENLLCSLICRIFRYRYVSEVPESLKDHSNRKMVLDLEKQRMLRRASEIPSVQSFQKDHDALGATLTFLYCASYPALLVFFIIVYQWWTDCVTEDSHQWLVFAIGALFAAAAFLCDLRYTRQDAWAVRNFPQKHPC